MRAPLVLVLLGLAFPASASAAADIEAVWSFSGGQIAVQAQADGTFDGTVVRSTTFSECTHPVGELVWDAVTVQPDGSYWGGHQWFRTPSCEPLARGNSAWRVLAKPDGSRFLRICFAPPENPEIQPTIAPDGTSTDATRGCSDSDLVAELPTTTPKVEQIAVLPKKPAKGCFSKRSFRIRLKEPPGDALRTALVFVNGKRVVTRRTAGRITAPVTLRGLPRGRYTVRITATTVLGRTITGTRRYRTCAKKRRSGDGGPL
jgi:hypothetical protein